jgi:hypothetical protein
MFDRRHAINMFTLLYGFTQEDEFIFSFLFSWVITIHIYIYYISAFPVLKPYTINWIHCVYPTNFQYLKSLY